MPSPDLLFLCHSFQTIQERTDRSSANLVLLIFVQEDLKVRQSTLGFGLGFWETMDISIKNHEHVRCEM